MPYAMKYIERERGLIIAWSGSATGEELVRSFKERFGDPDITVSLRYVISDYSDVIDFAVEVKDIRVVCAMAKEASRLTGELCMVGVHPTDVMRGMARMWQAYADDDDTGWHTKTVRTREECQAWLRDRIDPELSFGESFGEGGESLAGKRSSEGALAAKAVVG